jgi:hypothetical protein
MKPIDEMQAAPADKQPGMSAPTSHEAGVAPRWTMMVEAVLSMTMIVLLAARAVNIL